MSRRFAGVGVEIAPARLQKMAAGAPVTSDDSTNVIFALVATDMQRAERLAKLKGVQRCGIECLIFVGVALVMLALLICMVLAVIGLALHELPL